jgi:DNA-binding CsgD family transcriptional regulator
VVAWRLAARGDRRVHVRALARAALRPPGRSLPFLPRIHACRALLLVGDPTAALRGLDAVLLDARRAGAAVAAALALLERARCELARGRIRRTGDDLAAARRELPLSSWHPRLLPWLVALEAGRHLAADDLEAAERALSTDLPPSAADGVAWAYLEYERGCLRMALADPSSALPHFLACGQVLTTRRWTNPAASAWRSMAAAAYAACGERAAAAVLIRDATDRARSWGAPLTRAQVHLLAARSGCGDVTSHLTEAVTLLPGGTGRSGVALAPRDGRDRSEATPSLSTADERLATLVAAGWTNADIARFLSVGTRTVEARLTALYRFLALSGRRQLAELSSTPPWRGDLRHDTETWFLRDTPPR